MLLPAVIIDDFLGPQASADMLAFALSHEADFAPSTTYGKGRGGIVDDFRKSLSYEGSIDAIIGPFAAAIARESERLRAATGCDRFDGQLIDLDLVAHGDGHWFKRHVDTTTGRQRALSPADRVLSLVYYVHAVPKAFSGGNLVMHALIGDETRTIEPRHDRLVAFPSIAPHEVEPISLPGNAFADARFSLVCWLSRQRAEAPAP